MKKISETVKELELKKIVREAVASYFFPLVWLSLHTISNIKASYWRLRKIPFKRSDEGFAYREKPNGNR